MKIALILITASFLLATGCKSRSARNELAATNPTATKEYPSVGLLEIFFEDSAGKIQRRSCTGFGYGGKGVITAASCLEQAIGVVGEFKDIGASESRILEFDKAFIHGLHQPGTPLHDMAFLPLVPSGQDEPPLPSVQLDTFPLPSLEGLRITVVGYGSIQSDGTLVKQTGRNTVQVVTSESPASGLNRAHFSAHARFTAFKASFAEAYTAFLSERGYDSATIREKLAMIAEKGNYAEVYGQMMLELGQPRAKVEETVRRIESLASPVSSSQFSGCFLSSGVPVGQPRNRAGSLFYDADFGAPVLLDGEGGKVIGLVSRMGSYQEGAGESYEGLGYNVYTSFILLSNRAFLNAIASLRDETAFNPYEIPATCCLYTDQQGGNVRWRMQVGDWNAPDLCRKGMEDGDKFAVREVEYCAKVPGPTDLIKPYKLKPLSVMITDERFAALLAEGDGKDATFCKKPAPAEAPASGNPGGK